jgi:hypothetical protein
VTGVVVSKFRSTAKAATLREVTMADLGPSFSQIAYPEWQAEYQAALLELDPKQLLERVKAAETAIFNRLQVLSGSNNSRAERQAIEDALASLRVLKRESLGFPDWEKK